MIEVFSPRHCHCQYKVNGFIPCFLVILFTDVAYKHMSLVHCQAFVAGETTEQILSFSMGEIKSEETLMVALGHLSVVLGDAPPCLHGGHVDLKPLCVLSWKIV